MLVHHGFGGMLSHLSSSESAPPLYYVLVWVWTQGLRRRARSAFARFSALAGTLTIPVLYAGGREISARVGLWAAALATFSPIMYYYSQEARAYALLVLFGAASHSSAGSARCGSPSGAAWRWWAARRRSRC